MDYIKQRESLLGQAFTKAARHEVTGETFEIDRIGGSRVGISLDNSLDKALTADTGFKIR